MQDHWSPTKDLTLSLGVRAERHRLGGGGATVPGPDGPISPTSHTFHLLDHVAPRAGISWDFTREGRGRLFAHAGRYLQKPTTDPALQLFSIFQIGVGFFRAVDGLSLEENLFMAAFSFLKPAR